MRAENVQKSVLSLATFSILVISFVAASPGPALQSSGLGGCRLDGSYFSRDGKSIFPVGAHSIPAKIGLQWPTFWNPADIEADFTKMQELGFNTVRLDLFWAWFEPRPGDYMPETFKQLDYLVSLAHR